MKLRPGYWLSLALHGVLVLLLVALTVESSPRVLFVDLLHGWNASASSAPAGALASSGAVAPRRVMAVRAARSQGGAATSSTTPAAPASSPPPPTAVTPAPATSAPVGTEIVAPPRAPVESAAARVDVAPVQAPSIVTPSGGVPGGSGAAGGSSDRPGAPGVAASSAGAGGRPGGGLESARGSSVAALGSGDGGGGLGLEYAGYLGLIRRRIQDALEYPLAARRRGATGTVVIEISVDAAGAIRGVTVVGSSSHALLNAAVLEAVRGVGRTPFPPGLRPRPLRAHLPIVFELQ